MYRDWTLAGSTKRQLARVGHWLLAAWFVLWSLDKLGYYLQSDLLAVDFHIYREAGALALAGGDPWTAVYKGYEFAAPPPTLIPYMLLAMIPDWLALLVSISVLAAASVLVVRLLRLPWWWLAFPPLVESVLAQNPDILVVALLVAGGRWAVFAPVFKIYGAIPLLAQKQWRILALAGAVTLLSLPFVPQYVTHFVALNGVLMEQAHGGLSAWGTWRVIPTALALLSLGAATSSWLVVPAIWPATQLHYACISMPAVRRNAFLAAAFSVSLPLLGPFAIVTWALWLQWLRVRAWIASRSAHAGLDERLIDDEHVLESRVARSGLSGD